MGVLLMLMTFGGLIGAVVLIVVSLATKRSWLRKFVVGGSAVWAVIYSALLLGSSLTSRERNIDAGDIDGKAFCGFYLDCHMHMAVSGVRTTKTIGDKTADGIFYVVKVKAFSDAKNPSVRLNLIEPRAIIVGSNGNTERDAGAEALLPSADVRLDRDITSSEVTEKEIVFDLPTTEIRPRLLITEGYGVDRAIEYFLIGDEDSILHARTYFKLQDQALASHSNSSMETTKLYEQ